MKVAVVYHFFPGYRQGIIDRMLRSSYDYVFVAGGESLTPGVPIANIPKSSYIEAPVVYLPCGFIYQRNIVSMAFKSDIDHFIFLGDPKFISTWISAVILRIRRKKVYFWTHGWTGKSQKIYNLFKNLFYSLADSLLLYGNWARKIAVEEGFRKDRLYSIYNSLDYSGLWRAKSVIELHEITSFKDEHYGSKDIKLLYCSGRLTEVKRLDMVIIAAKRLIDMKGRVGVCLIGDGPQMSHLKKLANDLSVPIHFVGESFDPSVIAICSLASTVTVCPEAAGLSVMQSLALGVPVVTTNDVEGQMPEAEAVIPGVTGGLYEKGNIDSLVKCLSGILKMESKELQRMSENCEQLIRARYTADYQISIIESAFRGESAKDENLSDVVS